MGRRRLLDPQVGRPPGAGPGPGAGFGEVEVRPSELRCWQGSPPRMPGPHRHDDIEVNLVLRAPLRYLFGGTLVEIRPGEAAMFWAAVPHGLIDRADNAQAYVCWLHLPLRIVLHWGLPEAVTTELLRGRPLLRAAADAHRLDADAFAQWARDLASGSSERRQVALLEIQAQLRRLLLGGGADRPAAPGWDGAGDAVRHASGMARFAATHFREQITAVDVARSAHLHPNYAMSVFHQVLGTTIGAYLSQWRVAEAQRLLLTTTATISDIAASAGFGSPSAFYAAFSRTCGRSPGAYRRAYRRESQPWYAAGPEPV